MRPIVPVLAVALVLILPGARAGTASDPLDSYFMDQAPVVLSASRLAQPVSESPAAMTIIDRDMIEASGAITLPDVLRLVPGFQVSIISGANLTAQYHGLASEHPKRMQILIDGRSVYHSAFGGVHWDSLPITLDDVDRIEVLRGSNAATFGSNAFMGVVNIITRHAARDRGHHLSLLDGYNGTRMAGWRFGDHIGRLDYRLSLSGFETDGFPNHGHTHTWWDSTGGPAPPGTINTGDPLLPESTRYQLARRDSQAILRMNLRGDYRMDNGDDLLLELGYAHNDRDNTLDNGNYDLLRPNQRLRAASQLLKWRRDTPDGSESSLQISHNRLRFDSRRVATLINRIKDPTGAQCAGLGLLLGFSTAGYPANTVGCLINAGPTLGGQAFDDERYDLEWQYRLAPATGWRTVLGAGLRLDTLDGSNFAVDNRSLERRQYRLFGNTEKHLGERNQWVLNAGLMLEHQQRLGDFASPRLALNLHLDDYNTLRLAVARAYRMPSLYEQFGANKLKLLDPSSVNPAATTPVDYTLHSDRGTHIRPERLDSIELGLVSANWLDGFSFDARLFHERLEDYIDEVLHQNVTTSDSVEQLIPGYGTHDVWVHENAGALKLWGFDLQARYHLSDRTLLNLAGSLVRAKGHRIKKRNAAGTVTSIAPIGDYVPRVTLSGLLSHRFNDGWSGSLAYYRLSQMNWPNDGDRLRQYDRLDLRLAKDFHLGGHHAKIELIAQDARNQAFREFRGDNKFERRVFLRLKLDTQ